MATKRDDEGIDEGQAKEELRKRSNRISAEDVEKLIEEHDRVRKKLKEVPGRFGKMVNQVKLLFEMVRDYKRGEYRQVPWHSIAMIVAALVYFLSPIDLIPDPIPIIGYSDDALILAVAIAMVHEDLRKYCEHKGYDPSKYF